MRLIAFMLFCFFVYVSSATAQDIFVRKNSAPKETEKKSEIPQAAHAPTSESIKSFAERYYTNCMSKKDKILKGEYQQKLCACSAEHMGKSMTVENIKTMSVNSPEGEAQRKRMLMEVYAPCIQYPASALLYENCISGPNVKTKLPNYQQVCGCMAGNMGIYIGQNGPAAIADSLTKNPNDQNPLASLLNSPGFQAQAQSELLQCITGQR